ncbi:MAG TPA: zf-HC2 domain-containing protein [Gemmatimonadaceae bacterium]|nr:zf-HC2 domain-containing protein [Gemmatimonadaceae bacterium]
MRQSDEHTQHPDEGTIHAWLDGALSPDESRAIDTHVAVCESCAASVAEARGLMAAASRVLSALDDIPAGVIPGSRDESGTPRDQLAQLRSRHAAEKDMTRRRWRRNGQLVAAASVAFVALGTATVFWRGSFRADSLPGAPRAEMEAQRSVAADAVAPAPATVPIAAPAPQPGTAAVGASREGKVASAPSGTADSAPTSNPAFRYERDSAPRRVTDEALEARERQATSNREQARRLQLQGLQQSGAGQQTTAGAAQTAQRQAQAAPPSPQQTLDAAKAAQAQIPAAEATRPAAPVPALQRTDSIATGNRRVDAEASAPLAAVGCYALANVSGDSRITWLPPRIRLDSTRVRATGDTVWYRAVSLMADSLRELEWRRVDPATVELAPRAAGAGPAARLVVVDVRLEQARALRDVVPTGARAAAPTTALTPTPAANEARLIHAARVDCPR